MAAVIQALAWCLAKVFGDNVLRFVAMKAIMIAIFTIVLPIILNNFIFDFMEITFNFVNDKMGGITGLSPATLSVTGIAAYLFTTCKIVESFSLVIGALCVRATLNLIPFSRV